MQLHTLVKQPVALLAALSLALAACGDSTAPDAPFDPAGMNSDFAAVQNMFSGPAFESFEAASEALNDVSGGGVAAIFPTSAIGNRAAALRYGQRMAARMQGSVAAGLRPNFDLGASAGTTWEYNSATEQYEPTERTGAPANGVRFILYAVDEFGDPILPLNENEHGYVQLTVTETATSASARLTIMWDGTSYLDYSVGLTSTMAALTITIDGFATNGTNQTNFEFTFQLSGSEGNGVVAVSYIIEVPTHNFRISSTATYQQASDALTLQFEARGDNGRITMNGTFAAAGGTVTVRVNGSVYATIIDNGSTVTITGADGEELTEGELAALGEAFFLADGGFDLFDGFVGPTGVF